MKMSYSICGVVKKFPSSSGWTYVAVPKKYTARLKSKRKRWGKFPIKASIGETHWETKLMLLKGGDFFVALNSTIRKKENILIGQTLALSFELS